MSLYSGVEGLTADHMTDRMSLGVGRQSYVIGRASGKSCRLLVCQRITVLEKEKACCHCMKERSLGTWLDFSPLSADVGSMMFSASSSASAMLYGTLLRDTGIQLKPCGQFVLYMAEDQEALGMLQNILLCHPHIYRVN